jgi:hypothetical protein
MSYQTNDSTFPSGENRISNSGCCYFFKRKQEESKQEVYGAAYPMLSPLFPYFILNYKSIK